MNNKIIKLKRFAKSIFHCERSAAILLALALVLSLGIMAVPIIGTVEASDGSTPTRNILLLTTDAGHTARFADDIISSISAQPDVANNITECNRSSESAPDHATGYDIVVVEAGAVISLSLDREKLRTYLQTDGVPLLILDQAAECQYLRQIGMADDTTSSGIGGPTNSNPLLDVWVNHDVLPASLASVGTQIDCHNSNVVDFSYFDRNGGTDFSGTALAGFNDYAGYYLAQLGIMDPDNPAHIFNGTNGWDGSPGARVVVFGGRYQTQRSNCTYNDNGKQVLWNSLNWLSPIPPLSEVWVDDDYTDGNCGGHTWGYDAFATIQNGIDGIDEGGTVYVAAGNYNLEELGGPAYEPVSIKKSITLSGAGSASTTLDPEYPTGVHCDVISIQASNVTIEGFTVIGGDFGVRISSSSAQTGIDFIDVIATENHGSGFVFDNLYGQQPVSDVTFLNCQANHNGNRGIYFAPNKDASDISLTNTDCDNNQIMGFNCQGTMTSLDITGGTFNDNVGGSPYGTSEGPYYGFGIRLENCNKVTISDVTAQGNGTDGPEEGGAGISIKNGSQNVAITDTTLGNNPIGLWLKSGDATLRLSIHLSNIKDNTNYGVKNDVTITTVDATNNWWGAASGPSGEVADPVTGRIANGTGDAVSSNVKFDPFLSPNLIITKTGPTTANKGNNITYTITYKNVGTFNATNVVITETYPSEVKFASATPAPNIGNNQWTIGNLAPGVEGTITVTVHIK